MVNFCQPKPLESVFLIMSSTPQTPDEVTASLAILNHLRPVAEAETASSTLARALRSTEEMSPSTSYRSTSGNGDELGGSARAGTAEDVRGADVLNGVVAGWGADTGQGALINTIDHDTLHDGMGID
ncbi:hypothetical protein KCU71_g127, partial [Aureobasidium melanogenum]